MNSILEPHWSKIFEFFWLREKIIWNFDDVQKAYGTRGYEAKKALLVEKTKG
jgi:hypothetical protein